MRFGVLTLPNRPWRALVQTWRALDADGWDAVYVADQLANPYRPGEPWLDAWACLGAMAMVTSRARIGPLVTSIVFRNPGEVARAALTVDAASGGRLDLGVGAGGSPHDHRLAEVDAWGDDERARRLDTFVRRTRALLEDEELRPRPEHGDVPLTLGGNSPGLLALAAELADAWNTYGGRRLTADAGRAAAEERMARLDELCRARGRDPRTLRRSVLLGNRFVAEAPFRSPEAFAEVATAWHALGFDELVVYADPYYMVPLGEHAPEGIVASIASEVVPRLREELA